MATAFSGTSGHTHTGSSGDGPQLGTGSITDTAITYAKIQNVTATDKVLGRSSVGAGTVEEIDCTSAGRALLAAASAAAQRDLLGLGSSTVATFTNLNLTDSTNQIVLDSDGTYTGTMTLLTLSADRTWSWPNATGTVILHDVAQTLSNKILDNTTTINIKDSGFTLQDDGDDTKLGVFQLSGLTTATTRTYTLPDASGTVLLNGDIGSTVQAYDADTAKTDVAQEYTAQQNIDSGSLTDAASISWNLNTHQVASVTLAGNRTLANPTNMKDGGSYRIIIRQDATGNRTLAYGSAYLFVTGVTPTLSTDANAVDILSCVSDGTNMFCSLAQDFS